MTLQFGHVAGCVRRCDHYHDGSQHHL